MCVVTYDMSSLIVVGLDCIVHSCVYYMCSYICPSVLETVSQKLVNNLYNVCMI